ncbi:MAG: sugar nucleotide-binding protein [Candidatus Promineifilaceae bacterium]|nr:sugar nucleotide-binding protein [Candidatus Promineifilaceae bacterium]
MARLLIIGGSSYLGQRLTRLARHSHEVLYTYYSQDPLALPDGRQLDIRRRPVVRQLVQDWQPTAIIHVAGSDRSPDMANVIVTGTSNVSAAAAAADVRLVHLSTDVLFDGEHAPYVEADRPAPLHAYGRAKAQAEDAANRHPNHAIVRTSLIYGLTQMDHATRWVADGLRTGHQITLFSNQIRNPVWRQTLAQACLELATNEYQGVLHVAGAQAMSRAEYGLRLLDWWGISQRNTLDIGPAEGAWPRDCRLDISLAQKVLTTPLPGVDAVLAAYASADASPPD